MCGRFVNLNKIDKLKKIFDIKKSQAEFDRTVSYNIAPSQESIIIINNFSSFEIEESKWGFKFLDKKLHIEKIIINSRIETIQEKIMFKDSFVKRKCVIPANGYYEWAIFNNEKKPFFIHVPDKETIYFAGIWKYLNFKQNTYKIFSIITKPSNYFLKELHERMPVTLSADEAKEYLENQDPNYLKKDFNSIIEEYLEFFKVSKYVNNPLNNSEECFNPIN